MDTKKIKDGGPALPQHEFVPLGGGAGYWQQAGGMSLRDWFAGQALAGRLAHGFISRSDAPIHARAVYEVADAMLAAREAKP